MMKETREQILGRAFDRHISVSAGAGSGKTRVLVQRFIHILEQHPGIDLSSIVAITFTRKAAAEMMKRVMDAVEEKLLDAINQERMLDVEMWSRIRQHLNAARISTIDSFCSQIVREYPIEAGVPHTLSPLPTSRAVTMRMQCIEEALIHVLHPDHPSKQLIDSLFHKHHHSTITKALDHLLQKGSLALNVLDELHTRKDEDIIEHAWKSIRKDLLEHMSTMFIVMSELPGFLDSRFIDAHLVMQWKSLRKQSLEILEQPLHDETFTFLRMVDALSKTIVSQYVTQKKTPAVKYVKFSDISIDDWIVSNYGLIEEIRKQCDIISTIGEIGVALDGGSLSAEKEALRFSRLLLDIALHASSLFEAYKRNEGTLEFNDVQTIAMELLEHPEAGPKIRSRIKFLMIDEFQDTNAMQYELASRIVRSLKGEKSDQDVNLYIVGDPKQSIYGFRSADVRVFGSASKDIQQANLFNGTVDYAEHLNEEEKTGKLSLSTSFRLLPGIIGFVNDLFSTLMGNKAEGYEVAYEQMIGGRNIGNEFTEKQEIGSISFLIHTQTNEDESQSMMDEAGLIASAIKDMVVNKSKKVWDVIKDEQGNIQHILRDVKFKDCTILYERRTMVHVLMAALRSEGIPYFTTGNKGFYTSPAIIDIRNYLTFLSNRNNELALAGILLSPFFGVSDDELYAIRNAYGRKSLWVAMNEYANVESGATQHLKEAVTILSALLVKAQTMSLPILIHTILEASHWRNIVKTMEDGAQWLANAEKLIGIAREFEQRGFRHIHALVQELQLAAEYDDESEAPIVNTEDAVNLMTIHASKGLEFPIVMLYDTNAKERISQPALFESDQFGIGLPLIKEYRVSGAHETSQSLISMAVSTERKARLLAEKKRLLYVALTRAKDHLFISTSHKDGKEYAERSMMHLISRHSSAYEIAILNTEGKSLYHTSIPVLDANQETVLHRELDIPISIIRTPFDIQTEELQESPVQEASFHLFEKSRQEYKDEWYSTSQFMLLQSDEDSFRKKYVFGFPDTKAEHHAGFMNDEGHGDISAAQYGILVHRVLEQIKTWIQQDGAINEDLLHSIIEEQVNDFMIYSSEKDEICSRLLTLCKTIHQSDFVQSHLSVISRIKTEYSLSIPINDDFFVVVYDVLIEKEDGKAQVWDWKTNACSTRSEVDALVKKYELQMKYYAYILHLMYPLQEIITTTLLFTGMIHSSDQQDWIRDLHWNRDDMPMIRQEIEQHIASAKKSTLL
ncbi:MAG: UvrD-helicase domain-containing protein [Ignavibacteria bacterium]|jgi:ATP-dependent helicase/nuclease subunit A